MNVVACTARQVRTRYRHDLRTLTYVTLDQGNGGIIRNLSSSGAAIQAVGALLPQQTVRLRFQLRNPRIRIDAHGEVTWASESGQCGIRFLDLPPETKLQLDQWIFGNLLELIPREALGTASIFHMPSVPSDNADNSEVTEAEESDGLIVSRSARRAIQLQPVVAISEPKLELEASSNAKSLPDLNYSSARNPDMPEFSSLRADWLSKPLSGRSLALLVDSLVITAGLLVFSLIFLATTHELPGWPLTIATFAAAALLVTAIYWIFFQWVGGSTLGKRLARLTDSDDNNESEDDSRFR
jgi:hypothetical protein